MALMDWEHKMKLCVSPDSLDRGGNSYSVLFLTVAQVVANSYIIILELGRLKGHLSRGQLQHICVRFDWHCGELPHAPARFRTAEKIKFILFCLGGVFVVTVFN